MRHQPTRLRAVVRLRVDLLIKMVDWRRQVT
jgi:hypothetical protein